MFDENNILAQVSSKGFIQELNDLKELSHIVRNLTSISRNIYKDVKSEDDVFEVIVNTSLYHFSGSIKYYIKNIESATSDSELEKNLIGLQCCYDSYVKDAKQYLLECSNSINTLVSIITDEKLSVKEVSNSYKKEYKDILRDYLDNIKKGILCISNLKDKDVDDIKNFHVVDDDINGNIKLEKITDIDSRNSSLILNQLEFIRLSTLKFIKFIHSQYTSIGSHDPVSLKVDSILHRLEQPPKEQKRIARYLFNILSDIKIILEQELAISHSNEENSTTFFDTSSDAEEEIEQSEAEAHKKSEITKYINEFSLTIDEFLKQLRSIIDQNKETNKNETGKKLTF